MKWNAILKWYLIATIAALSFGAVLMALFYLGKLYIKLSSSNSTAIHIPEFSLRVEVEPQATQEIRAAQGQVAVKISISGLPNSSLKANGFLPMIENLLLIDGKSGQVSIATMVYTLPPEGGVVEVKNLTISEFIFKKLQDNDFRVSATVYEIDMPRKQWFLSCERENFGSQLSDFRTAPIKTIRCKKNALP